ncbi:hypothetical protein COCSUDRAFT_60635 [Coccomyxa subellipsoidea C-169]|uniref:Uncharacterized protein n=1 Tax=Coccomyxa subellipsoidea (strain C-169) TaxID=574566 RepID=I0YHY8_COCSC|nr:hypothetical protein COCSUDRAFT_60635 [Coccomyxa subellipsoidea C-169]EIE18007.1 hypothetical protein COCSUDRAFT_60635 [Coccomyxa subellipsoidea C-169]|eukprot:XP_005642551.1 hypothetical protein COCSUDRAFT_60635 [Coccomyxa subellipsoidea C-169]
MCGQRMPARDPDSHFTAAGCQAVDIPGTVHAQPAPIALPDAVPEEPRPRNKILAAAADAYCAASQLAIRAGIVRTNAEFSALVISVAVGAAMADFHFANPGSRPVLVVTVRNVSATGCAVGRAASADEKAEGRSKQALVAEAASEVQQWRLPDMPKPKRPRVKCVKTGWVHERHREKHAAQSTGGTAEHLPEAVQDEPAVETVFAGSASSFYQKMIQSPISPMKAAAHAKPVTPMPQKLPQLSALQRWCF